MENLKSTNETKKYNYLDMNKKTDELYKDELDSAIAHLNGLDDISKIFSDEDLAGYRAAIFIGKTITFSYKINLIDFLVSKSCEKFISKILIYLYKIHNEINFEIKSDLINAEKSVEADEKKMNILSLILYITNILAQTSLCFIQNLAICEGLKAHFLFISDKEFLDKNLDKRIFIWSKYINIVEYFVMNISSFSKTCDDNQTIWFDLDSVNSLLNIAKLKESAMRDAYVAIINIVDDKLMESLFEMSSIKSIFVNELKQCYDDFTSNKFQRVARQFNFDGTSITCMVHCITQQNQTVTSIIIILRALYRLSINKKMKSQLFDEDNISTYIKILLQKGNYYEIYFTLEVLAQITFDERAAHILANDLELAEILTRINEIKLEKIENENERKVFSKGVLKYIEQINWNLNKKVQNSNDNNLENQKDHIMISYNAINKEMCLKIKKNLEDFGLKVWIEMNDKHEQNLDEMATAIEKSFCVLMCVSEKYRQSINCQVEAQYAFRMKKIIIPLIMQSGYESVQGWLGIIMTKKICVDFTKSELDECFKQLRHEIKMCQNSFNEKIEKPLNIDAKNEISTLEWTDKDVNEWFSKNELSREIFNYLKPCTGIVLNQVYEMKCNAPEFYYQSLSKAVNTSISSISLFTFHLNKLFES